MAKSLEKSRNLIQEKQIYSRLIVTGALILFLSILLRTAWMSDDAFITLRTLDNFVNGLGLTWNPAERVQAFTHPLWLFILSPFYYFSREPYYTTLIISLLLSFGAVCLMAFHIRLSWYQTLTAILLLCCSKAFTDFATSGLENPLAYFLIALFIIEYKSPHITFRMLLSQSLWVSLILLTRQDLGIIFLPALLYSALRYKKWAGIFALGTGLLPWVFWILFSLFYYGFPVPNTAYAKLQTGIPEIEILGQGIQYFINSLKTDPVTLISILAMMFYLIRSGRKRWLVISISVFLYLLYVLQIGGDFMSGRFFAVPVFTLLLGLNSIPVSRSPVIKAVVISLLVSIGLFTPFSPVLSGKSYRKKDTLNELMDTSGIVDERGFYYQSTGLLTRDHTHPQVKHIDAERGRLAKAVGQKLNINGAVGLLGYYAGPGVHIIDYYGLGDPLLSRLPVVEQDSLYLDLYRNLFRAESAYGWRAGHYRRAIPAGYMKSILLNQNFIADPQIHAAWELIHSVTSEPLWAETRLQNLKKLWFEMKLNPLPQHNRTPWQNPDYEEILEADPNCVSTLYLTAGQAFREGNPLKAKERLEKVMLLSPYYVSANQKDFANAWYALAIRFSEDKKFNLSLGCARKAEMLGQQISPEVFSQLEENAEMESLFFPDRTKR